jgi:ABC-type amino acid transport substrate-binding protein
MSKIEICIILLVVSAFANGLVAQETTYDRVKRARSITFVGDRQNMPYASDRDSLPGIDVELARLIAKELKIRLYYRWIDTSHENLLEFIENGEADLALGVAQDSRQVGRKHHRFGEKVTFTRPYYSTGYVAVVPKSRPGSVSSFRNPGKVTIGIEQGALIERKLQQWNVPAISYSNQLAVLLAIRKGDVDAGALWADAGYHIHENPGLNVQLAPGFTLDTELQMNVVGAVRREDGKFVELINRGLQRVIESGAVQQVLHRYHVPFFSPAGKQE